MQLSKQVIDDDTMGTYAQFWKWIWDTRMHAINNCGCTQNQSSIILYMNGHSSFYGMQSILQKMFLHRIVWLMC